jgi:signal transduction histidine kinase
MVEDLTIAPGSPPVEAAADYAVRYPLRPLVLAGLVTLISYAGGVVATGFVTHVTVAPVKWWWWIVTECLFLAAWLALVAIMWFRQPDARETVVVWGHASRSLTYLSQLFVAWAIWIFFPYCPEAQRLMLAGMFMLCSPAQLIAAPENVMANRVGIVASNGSLVAWFALHGSPNGYALGGFALVIGIMLFMLCGYLPGTVAATVAARLTVERTKAELERALADVAYERDAKTRFIAEASHDLGQPLQAASLFFDQTLRAPNPEQRSRAADGVRKAFASADQLLSHMLNHLRLEADAVDPHFARFAVGPAMSRIAAQFTPAASAAGIAIHLVTSRKHLRLDKVLFERALVNLVSNAIEHSGATRIVMGARASGDRVRIWVIDDGSGIARIDAARIFDDYYRGSDSRAAVKSGFGLGLSSVRRIATLMNGAAGLDPRWLRGAAFYLDFPAAGSAKETAS